jgi:hypothetical protein
LIQVTLAAAATDGPYQDVYYVYSCGSQAAPTFTAFRVGLGFATPNNCGSVIGGLDIDAGGKAANGDLGQWSTETPSPAVRIIGFNPTLFVDCNLHGDGFNASYFYGDNGVNYGVPQITVNCHGGTGNWLANTVNPRIQSSRYFGWHTSCQISSGCFPTGTGPTVLSMYSITLEAQDTTPPTIAPVGTGNLWSQSGWVRGAWPMTIAASDPSGVCTMVALVAGQVVAKYTDPSPDTTQWTQCHGSQLPVEVDTTSEPDGPLALRVGAWNAAGAFTGPSSTVKVDNQPVNVTMSSPGDVLSTAGTQYVTATATAGPSGVAGIWCRTDGGAYGWHPGATAHVMVQGIGGHLTDCYAQNNAVDAGNVAARSALRSASLSIRQPTVSGLSFSRLVDKLRCHRAVRRVIVPGHTRTVRRHGRTVTIYTPAHAKRIHVVKCHPRIVRRRVTVTTIVRRHGRTVEVKRTKIERVVVLPHVVNSNHRRIRFGAATTIHGWVGLGGGIALAHRPVLLMTAPADGQHRFALAARATTGADGSWTATLPPGPSRLIQAVYPGDGTTEPAFSPQATVTVPAKVQIAISPRRVAWGGTITIEGRVLGGHIPNSSKLLRLDIGIKGLHAIQGIPEVAPSGRFRTTYTFNRAQGSIRFYFTVATLAEADYPYAPASSRRVTVTVGPAVH